MEEQDERTGKVKTERKGEEQEGKMEGTKRELKRREWRVNGGKGNGKGKRAETSDLTSCAPRIRHCEHLFGLS